MQTLWAIYVVCFVLAPLIIAVTGGNYSVWVFALFLGLPALFTLVARMMGVGWLEFWSVPTAAALPWVVSLAFALTCAHFLPRNLQQAAGMSAIAPLFGLVGAAGLGFLSAMVMGPDVPLESRIKRPLMLSAPWAVVVTLFLAWVYYQDIRASGEAAVEPAEKPPAAEGAKLPSAAEDKRH